jgi:hypothetical protein
MYRIFTPSIDTKNLSPDSAQAKLRQAETEDQQITNRVMESGRGPRPSFIADAAKQLERSTCSRSSKQNQTIGKFVRSFGRKGAAPQVHDDLQDTPTMQMQLRG